MVVSKRINERRANSANVPEEQRATIATDGTATKTKNSFLSGFILVVAILVALITFVLFAANGVISLYYSKVNTGSYNEGEITVTNKIEDMYPYEIEDAKFSDMKDKVIANFNTASKNIKVDENVLNYVIVGVDKLTDDASAGHADVIVVASVNKNTNEITYAKLNSRVLTYIPDVEKVGPMQDAYEWGGAALLAKTVSQNMGIGINGYVEINIKGFADVVDKVGGITLALSDSEIANVNAAISELKDRFGMNGITDVAMEDGRVHLNGDQALAYLRGTSLDGRNDAIMRVLSKATKAAISQGFGGVKGLADALTASAATSATREDVASMFQLALEALDKTGVETIVFGKDVVDSFRGSLYTVDYAAERAAMVSALYGA